MEKLANEGNLDQAISNYCDIVEDTVRSVEDGSYTHCAVGLACTIAHVTKDARALGADADVLRSLDHLVARLKTHVCDW